jgi:hypothetical protein
LSRSLQLFQRLSQAHKEIALQLDSTKFFSSLVPVLLLVENDDNATWLLDVQRSVLALYQVGAVYGLAHDLLEDQFSPVVEYIQDLFDCKQIGNVALNVPQTLRMQKATLFYRYLHNVNQVQLSRGFITSLVVLPRHGGHASLKLRSRARRYGYLCRPAWIS